MSGRLDRLLRPKSIAVIGGGAFATNVVEQCLKTGFSGGLWPVHPTKEMIAGVKAYRSVEELPNAPDASFIGVNRRLTPEIVKSLRKRNAGGAICFAAGFLETKGDDTEGAALQVALVEAAGSMPIIGPNCYGLINYADGALLWPDQHGGRRLEPGERGVAIITQSSNIACNLTMQRRGLPIAYLMTAGNQAQTGLSEMALGLIEDARVSALGLHIEGFDSVSGFERLAARARELRKPIVAIKAGRSEQARAATISHTASLAGSDAASEAFLGRLGIARVDTIPSFLETLKLLHTIGPLAGYTLSSMSCSGGEASVMADSVEGRKLCFPVMKAEHRARVKETLGSLVAVANPLDYNTFIWNNEPALNRTFSAFVSGGFDLNMLVLDFPRADRCSDADWWPTVCAFEAALKANGAKGAIVSSMAENLPEEYAADLLWRGIVPFMGVAEAMDATEAAAGIGERWKLPSWPPIGGTGAERSEAERGNASVASFFPPLRPGCAGPPLPPMGGEEGRQPDEAEAKALLVKYRLPVPPGRKAMTPDEAAAAAEQIGFPVALKALGVAHKSEHGAVHLGLADADAVRAAATELLPLGSGLYVETMINGGIAELIIGVMRDPLFGPVMTVGSGGVLVELLKDSATLLLPASREEIETALRGLQLFPLLDGYRGRPKADLDAAVDAILGIASFALEHAETIEELDINPLIVCRQGEGAWIVDALMVCAGFPSTSRGGLIDEVDPGGVLSAAGPAKIMPSASVRTTSARFASTSPSREEEK